MFTKAQRIYMPLLSLLCLGLCLGPLSAGLATAQEEEAEPDVLRLPDPTYILEAIHLEGNSQTRQQAIYDALDLEIGQEVNVALLRDARLRLLATGFFDTAQFGLEGGSERGQVILNIRLHERNTVLLSDLFLGSSTTTPFWGGLGIVDSNFFGTGHTARAAFVASGDSVATELSYLEPALVGSRFSLGAGFHFSYGKDYAFAPTGEPDAFRTSPLRYTRLGGRLSAGVGLLPTLGLFLDLRSEWLEASADEGPLFRGWIQLGQGVLSTATLTLDYDSRDDPVMPTRGARANLAVEASLDGALSDYSYVKNLTQFTLAYEFVPGHIARFDLFAGAIFGDAPFFERFFIGDFNDLVSSRNLGLNFAARAPVDFFNTGAGQLNYEAYLSRIAVEYAVPINDRIPWIYRTEFFLGAGLLGATTRESKRPPTALGLEPTTTARSIFPIDLTVNLGLRVETDIGIFGLSFANALALIPL